MKLKVSALDLNARFQMFKNLLDPEIELLFADIRKIKNRSWDRVNASQVVEHVPNPTSFLNELQRVARDFVLVACPWNEDPLITSGHTTAAPRGAARPASTQAPRHGYAPVTLRHPAHNRSPLRSRRSVRVRASEHWPGDIAPPSDAVRS